MTKDQQQSLHNELKQRAITALNKGWHINVVADILGVNRRTLYRWKEQTSESNKEQ